MNHKPELVDAVAEAIYNSSFKGLRPPWNIMSMGDPEVFAAYRDNAREEAIAALNVAVPRIERAVLERLADEIDTSEAALIPLDEEDKWKLSYGPYVHEESNNGYPFLAGDDLGIHSIGGKVADWLRAKAKEIADAN